MAYQRTAEWWEERKSMIGSSDAPRLVGVSRWGGPIDVYLEKTNDDPMPKDTEQQGLGVDLEEAIAKSWAAKQGFKIRRRHLIVRAKAQPYLGASLDFEIVGGRAIVEVKTRRSSKGWGEPGTATVPEDVWVQVQHQMLCTGYRRAYVVVMLAGAPPVAYEIDVDDEFIERYRLLAKDFWENNVLARVPPDYDGSTGGDRILAAKYPESTGQVVATPEAENLVGSLIDIRRRKAALLAEEATIVQRIKDYISNAEMLIGPGFRIRYKWSKAARQTAWRLVADAYRGMIKGHSKEELDTIVSMHTTEKAAARPFAPEFDEEVD